MSDDVGTWPDVSTESSKAKLRDDVQLPVWLKSFLLLLPLQQPPLTQAQKRSLAYHLHTIWLFTASDIQSVIVPETLLGLASALTGSLLTTNPNPHVLDVLARTPRIMLWNWLNLFLFDLDNQFQPGSVLEDSVNKPWRAIPSGRLTAKQARRLLLFTIPSVFAATLWLGGLRESVTLAVMTWMYNDLGGADDSIVTRNALNGLGYMCYSSGSMIVAAGYGLYEPNATAQWWLVMIGGIIFTTLQMQDMADVEGDAARGRRTVPLIFGDAAARYTIAIPVLLWSYACAYFWGLPLLGYVGPLAVGLVFAFRLLTKRGIAADQMTWKFWCLWMSTIYLLPLWREHSALVRFFYESPLSSF